MDFARFVRLLLEKLSIFIACPMRTDTASVRFCANSSKMSCLPCSPFCLLKESARPIYLYTFYTLVSRQFGPALPMFFGRIVQNRFTYLPVSLCSYMLITYVTMAHGLVPYRNRAVCQAQNSKKSNLSSVSFQFWPERTHFCEKMPKK